MAKRSLFQMIFGVKEQTNQNQTQLQLLDGYTPQWSTYNKQIYDNSEVRACIDAIARNGAKLSPKHIRKTEKGYTQERGKIYDLISKRPNEFMNAYDFYYKVISELYLNNNAFVYVSRGKDGTPVGLYPLRAGMYTLLEAKGEIFIRFNFNGGQSYVASLKDDIIHLKRFFCNEEVIGGNSLPIIKTMSLKHVIDEGITNAIKTTQSIRGILKSTKAMLKPEDLQRNRDRFIETITSSKSGIASIDATSDFQSISLNPITATDGQIDRVNKEILNYYGVSEEILRSNYNEDQWSSFYESVIEPIAIMMGLEFTNKLFTYGEKWHGNEIMFESNRLQYASFNTKINLLKEAGAIGILTINECREVLNLAPVEDGDQRVQSLNYIDKTDDGRSNNE